MCITHVRADLEVVKYLQLRSSTGQNVADSKPTQCCMSLVPNACSVVGMEAFLKLAWSQLLHIAFPPYNRMTVQSGVKDSIGCCGSSAPDRCQV